MAFIQAVQTLSPIAAATPTLAQSAAGSLSIGAGVGTTYRGGEGSWILRANVIVRNTGAEPVDVNIDQFHNGVAPRAPSDSSFPEHTTLAPGLTVQGDIAFSVRPAAPRPTTLALTHALAGAPPGWRSVVPLMFSPAPPAHGYAPASAVNALGVGISRPAVTWSQPEAGRILQFTITVNNTTWVPIEVPRSYLVPTVGSDHGALWAEGSSLPDTLPIPSGGHVSGTIAFVFGAGTPAITSVPVTFGPPNNPQSSETILAVEVPAPPPA